MEDLKQVRHDVVYNFIYEIQHMESNGKRFGFFSDGVIDNVLLDAIRRVTLDLNTVDDFDESKFGDADLSDKIQSLPKSLQGPIVLKAAIHLISHFLKATNVDSEVVDIMNKTSSLANYRDGFEDLLSQYKDLYQEITKDLKKYAEQNGIEQSDTDRLAPIPIDVS